MVTGVDFTDSQAGTGTGGQISLAAYGFFDGTAPFTGPAGMLSTYPATTQGEVPPLITCSCREEFNGDSRYAYLEGTSMAAPQVTATAAMIGKLNPFLTASQKIRHHQGDRAPLRRLDADLGWGVLDAGRAVDAARRVDTKAPESNASSPKRRRVRRGRRARVRISVGGSDEAGAPGLVASGVDSFDLYMKRGKGAFRRVRAGIGAGSQTLRLRPGVYRFYSRAIDAAGNREPEPGSADSRTRCARGSAGSAGLGRLGRLGGREQLLERLLEVPRELVQVRHRVVVGEQAEVELAVVAHRRDGQRMVVSGRKAIGTSSCISRPSR